MGLFGPSNADVLAAVKEGRDQTMAVRSMVQHIINDVHTVLDNANHDQSQLEKLMATLAEQLDGIDASLTEAKTEITGKLDELQAALDAAGQISPEVQAKLDAVSASARGLADIVPNATDPGEDDGEDDEEVEPTPNPENGPF